MSLSNPSFIHTGLPTGPPCVSPSLQWPKCICLCLGVCVYLYDYLDACIYMHVAFVIDTGMYNGMYSEYGIYIFIVCVFMRMPL